ncbi:MAG: Coq4 family protein [Kofleriaceae bacterium]
MDTSTIDATKLPATERWRRALTALARVLANPTETDQVLVFSMYMNAGSMPSRIHRFFDDARGQRLFDEHRTIDTRTVDLAALAQLPEGTLGRAYAEFLSSRGLSPDVFQDAPKEVPDPRMAYVIQRIRQTHDLWHVVTGYNTDAASEVALQAFTFAQVRAPSSAILAVLGTMRAARTKPDLPRDVVRAFRLGRRAKALPVFPWEDHWTTPLAEVRVLLGLPAVPAHAA